jgi:hypothetical protein
MKREKKTKISGSRFTSSSKPSFVIIHTVMRNGIKGPSIFCDWKPHNICTLFESTGLNQPKTHCHINISKSEMGEQVNFLALFLKTPNISHIHHLEEATEGPDPQGSTNWQS